MSKFDSSLTTEYINTQMDLVQIAMQFGYTKEHKESTSVNWITLQNNNGDKVSIKRGASPQWYINRQNDNDKGQAFQFILNRIDGPVSININPTSKDRFKVFEFANDFFNLPEIKLIPFKKTTPGASQNDALHNIKALSKKLNIGPLSNAIFLNKSRCISLETINHPMFHNRIFNALKKNENGSVIPNIAFPKFNPDTLKISGYEIRNHNFKSVEGIDYHLWLSRFPKHIESIAIVESAINAISHFDLKKETNNNTLYVSLGGNISDNKRESLNTLIQNIKKQQPNVNLKLLTDNDVSGTNYDIKICVDLINKHQDTYQVSEVKEDQYMNLKIVNLKHNTLDVEEIYKSLKISVDTFNNFDKNKHLKATVFQRQNEIDFKFPLYTDFKNNNSANVIGLLQKFNSLLNPIKVKFEKSLLNDWNDDLKKKVTVNVSVKPKNTHKL